MKILITGSRGFIGQHLIQELNDKHDLFFFDRNNESKSSSFLSIDDLEQKKTSLDAVIHLSARVHQMEDKAKDPLVEFRKANCELTKNIAQLSLECGAELFIMLSSVKVIGEIEGFFNEKDTPIPTDPYGISKLEAEEELKKLEEKNPNFRYISIRSPMVYGPKNKGNMIRLLKAAKAGFRLPLKNAKKKRSIIYVKNLTAAITSILENTKKKPSSPYFVSDPNSVSSKELYDKIFYEFHNKSGTFFFPASIFKILGTVGSVLESLINKKLPINQDLTSRLFEQYEFSSKKFQKDYQFQAPFTTEEGIKKTVKWFQNEYPKQPATLD